MVIAYMLKFQSIDVQGERLMKEDVVPKTSLVSMVRATVTLIKNVKETLCVETTTVNSLLPTSIPRTTVVRDPATVVESSAQQLVVAV